MRRQPFILATAGHVDHGKSALVLALTGTDPDRLPEEKARGITIDLGFAHLELPAGPGNRHGASHYDASIIDVPGHEDFVRNMVAGVGSIDAALLVVAADEGWKPQTEEHLQILVHLGVDRAVVALTKADLQPRPDDAVAAIRQQLAGTPFAGAPVVPVSARTGTGLGTLRAALAALLDHTPPPANPGRPRLWIDRVFVVRGAGTVVTGTLSGGTLHRGDPVVIQPGNRPARIRSVQVHGRDCPEAHPGSRVALNLPEQASAVADPIHGLRRGDVVAAPEAGPATATWDGVIRRSARPPVHGTAHPRPLRSGMRVQVHVGSTHVPARLLLLDREELAAGATALAQLRLETPALAFAGDRFVVRDTSQRRTLAGGMVLDPDALRPRARTPERLRLLAACTDAPAQALPALRLRFGRDPALRPGPALARSRFEPDAIAAAMRAALEAGEVLALGDWLLPASVDRQLRQDLASAIDEHRRSPSSHEALSAAVLRSALATRHRFPTGFPIDDWLHAAATQAGLQRSGEGYRPATQPRELPEELVRAIDDLRRRLLASPLEPPSRAELLAGPGDRRALRHLLDTGAAIEAGPDLVLAAEAYALARTRIRTELRRRGRATTSELRQALGTSRRVLVPLLERLDREGITRRDGDHRFLPADRKAGPDLNEPRSKG